MQSDVIGCVNFISGKVGVSTGEVGAGILV